MTTYRVLLVCVCFMNHKLPQLRNMFEHFLKRETQRAGERFNMTRTKPETETSERLSGVFIHHSILTLKPTSVSSTLHVSTPAAQVDDVLR